MYKLCDFDHSMKEEEIENEQLEDDIFIYLFI